MTRLKSGHDCPYCRGERWIDDQNWSAADPELYWRFGDSLRTPGDGRIPCGRCNFAGWDVPDGKRDGVAT